MTLQDYFELGEIDNFVEKEGLESLRKEYGTDDFTYEDLKKIMYDKQRRLARKKETSTRRTH